MTNEHATSSTSLRDELENAAHVLTNLLSLYKTVTHQHPDDEVRIMTIGYTEAQINRYRKTAGLDSLEFPDE